jgi:hypothetical protein
MKRKGKRFLAIGGAGLIGSHTVDMVLQEDAREVVIYDNFVRGGPENLAVALKDSRVTIHEVGGDIRQTDNFEAVLADREEAFQFSALWLPQCHGFPRAAFELNIGRHVGSSCGQRQTWDNHRVYASPATGDSCAMKKHRVMHAQPQQVTTGQTRRILDSGAGLLLSNTSLKFSGACLRQVAIRVASTDTWRLHSGPYQELH